MLACFPWQARHEGQSEDAVRNFSFHSSNSLHKQSPIRSGDGIVTKNHDASQLECQFWQFSSRVDRASDRDAGNKLIDDRNQCDRHWNNPASMNMPVHRTFAFGVCLPNVGQQAFTHERCDR